MIFKSLENKTVIITGASSGLGFEIAKAFLKSGSNIIVCSRTAEDLNQAVEKFKKLRKSDQEIFSYVVDVSKKDQINHFLEKCFKSFKKIDILVNNAGIVGPTGNFEDLDWDDWKYTLDVNFLGSAYLIKKLIPEFKTNNFGRIIQISGGGAASPLPYQSIYAASKAAIVRFIETISVELEGYNITANCIAPGQLKTRIMSEYLNSGPERLGEKYYKKVLKNYNSKNFSFEKPINLTLALGSSEYPPVNGKLISANWDDWPNFDKFLDELNNSDVYTIRRIIARDRSYRWGDL